MEGNSREREREREREKERERGGWTKKIAKPFYSLFKSSLVNFKLFRREGGYQTTDLFFSLLPFIFFPSLPPPVLQTARLMTVWLGPVGWRR